MFYSEINNKLSLFQCHIFKVKTYAKHLYTFQLSHFHSIFKMKFIWKKYNEAAVYLSIVCWFDCCLRSHCFYYFFYSSGKYLHLLNFYSLTKTFMSVRDNTYKTFWNKQVLCVGFICTTAKAASHINFNARFCDQPGAIPCPEIYYLCLSGIMEEKICCTAW